MAEEVRHLCHRIEALAERTVEQELIDVFAPAPYERNAQILIGYYGWDDGCPHTLTEIGERFGITRERVRQVCAKFTKKLQGASTMPAPTLDRALALVAAQLPCSAARLEAELIDGRLTSVGMSVEALAAAARLLGRAVGFKVVKIEGEKGASSPLKKGTGSEPSSEKTRENDAREVPVPLFQQAVSPAGAKPDGSRESAAGRSAQSDASPPPAIPSENRLVVAPDQLEAALAAVDLAKKEILLSWAEHGGTDRAKFPPGQERNGRKRQPRPNSPRRRPGRRAQRPPSPLRCTS